jgi:predicted GIY-YIG superfamily endonuclease
MVNYSNGKIYKIEPTVEHEDGDIYIGSTTNKLLCQRMGKHRGHSTDSRGFAESLKTKVSNPS